MVPTRSDRFSYSIAPKQLLTTLLPVIPSPDPYWIGEFKQRMAQFGESAGAGKTAVSIKVRVDSGCFHREHSPEAYRIIDSHLARVPLIPSEARFEEHESGPEILANLPAMTAGIALTASLINLVVAILRARSDGIKKGDRPQHPLEVIIRRINRSGVYEEEKILRVPTGIDLDAAKITKEFLKHVQLSSALQKMPRQTRPARQLPRSRI